MLPLDGYEDAERKGLSIQTCGWSPDGPADAGNNIYFHHILAAINERRAAIKEHAPHYWNGAEVDSATWNSVWEPLDFDTEFGDLDNVELLDAIRHRIVQDSAPDELSAANTYIGMFMTCCDVIDGVAQPSSPFTTRQAMLTRGIALAGTDAIKIRYALDGSTWRGLFGTWVDWEQEEPIQKGWYVGRDDKGEHVYAADLASGIERLNGAPLLCTAQHFNELVFAVNMCAVLIAEGCETGTWSDFASVQGWPDEAYALLPNPSASPTEIYQPIAQWGTMWRSTKGALGWYGAEGDYRAGLAAAMAGWKFVVRNSWDPLVTTVVETANYDSDWLWTKEDAAVVSKYCDESWKLYQTFVTVYRLADFAYKDTAAINYTI